MYISHIYQYFGLLTYQVFDAPDNLQTPPFTKSECAAGARFNKTCRAWCWCCSWCAVGINIVLQDHRRTWTISNSLPIQSHHQESHVKTGNNIVFVQITSKPVFSMHNLNISYIFVLQLVIKYDSACKQCLVLQTQCWAHIFTRYATPSIFRTWRRAWISTPTFASSPSIYIRRSIFLMLLSRMSCPF